MSGRIEEYRGTSYNDPDEAHDAGQMRIPCMVVVMSLLSVRQKRKCQYSPACLLASRFSSLGGEHNTNSIAKGEGVMELATRLQQKITEFAKTPYFTLYVVDPVGVGREACLELAGRKGYAYINCNIELSQRLEHMDQRLWCIRATDVLRSVLPQGPNEVAILGDIQILFAPEMKLHVIPFIEGLRSCSLIVLWPGDLVNDQLFYSEPNSPDFCKTKVRPYQLVV